MKFKLVEELVIESTLNEAKDWYEISGGPNSYYLYGTSTNDVQTTIDRIFGVVPRTGSFKQSFDPVILQNFKTDYSTIPHPVIRNVGSAIPTANILTVAERQLRKNSVDFVKFLDSTSSHPRFNSTKPYVHHCNKHEYDNTASNLLVWENNPLMGKIAHIVAHEGPPSPGPAPNLYNFSHPYTDQIEILRWNGTTSTWDHVAWLDINIH